MRTSWGSFTMNDLPSNVTDLSGLFVQIKNNCDAIAMLQIQARLDAFTKSVGDRDGINYQRWQMLPEKALLSLNAKLSAEFVSLQSQSKKAIAPPASVDGVVPKSDEFF